MTSEFGDIMSRTIVLLRTNAARAALALAVMAGLGFLIDSGVTSEERANGLTFIASIATLILQYWLTRGLLAELGFEVSQNSRIIALFGLGIVTGLGIALGFVLLVIPGLVLFARWSIATPLLLTSNEGVFACIEQSWRQTKGYAGPIIASFLVIYLPGLGLFFAGVWLAETSGLSHTGIIAMNLMLNASLIAGWHASVAIFTLLHSSPRVAEIFE
jgi:hypothetical protein